MTKRFLADAKHPRDVATDFRGSGTLEVSPSRAKWREFVDCIAPAVQALDERLSAIPPGARKRRDEELSVGSLVEEANSRLGKILSEVGVLEAARGYLGDDVNVSSPVLLFSTDATPYLKNRFKDHNVDDPPTAYLHFDTNWHTTKLMIYLSDVADENGPFCYLPRPNYKMSFVSQAIRKACDYSTLQASSHPKYRRLFTALPAVFRKKASFGDDLLPEDPRTEAILANERRFTGAAGSMIIFDGDHGIHRGNLIREGTRRAMTINLVSDSYSKAFRSLKDRNLTFDDDDRHQLARIGALPTPDAETELERFAEDWCEKAVYPLLVAEPAMSAGSSPS